MLKSYFQAGTGAVLVETREEWRFLRETSQELKGAELATIVAPGGKLRVLNGQGVEVSAGLGNGYAWLQQRSNRVLVVFDWHVICNNPMQWRGLIDSLPGIKSPQNDDAENPSSLAVFVGPLWNLEVHNPLYSVLPILRLAPPDREGLRDIADKIHPLNGNTEQVIDGLCGLTSDAAEQACAEVLARTGGEYNHLMIRDARKQALKDAGLEIWEPTKELGGLQGVKDLTEQEILPWLRDRQLAVRRLLSVGLPGTGKSFFARWLANRIGCECCRLSMPNLKKGIVGASEGALKNALSTIDAMSLHAPLVVVLDEVDTIAREGLDGGTSSGMFAELLTWLQESPGQAIVVATLNHLDKLDAALASRMNVQMWFDLPVFSERVSVAEIHYKRLSCNVDQSVLQYTAQATDGYSNREIAEYLCPTVARLSKRTPDIATIDSVTSRYNPASRKQSDQLTKMREAAQSLRRANDPIEVSQQKARRIAGVKQ